MNNPTALVAAIAIFLLAVAYAVRREDAPWYVAVLMLLILSMLFLNGALNTPSLAEITGECK